MAGLNNNPTIARGAPEPQNFGRNGGFEHPHPGIDDNITQEATLKGGYSDEAARDVGAIEINFDRMAHGLVDASYGSDYLIPGWVAENGMNPARANEVAQLLRQVGAEAGLEPEMVREVEGMYRDGIESQGLNLKVGVQPYGLQPNNLGSWTD